MVKLVEIVFRSQTVRGKHFYYCHVWLCIFLINFVSRDDVRNSKHRTHSEPWAWWSSQQFQLHSQPHTGTPLHLQPVHQTGRGGEFVLIGTLRNNFPATGPQTSRTKLWLRSDQVWWWKKADIIAKTSWHFLLKTLFHWILCHNRYYWARERKFHIRVLRGKDSHPSVRKSQLQAVQLLQQ